MNRRGLLKAALGLLAMPFVAKSVLSTESSEEGVVIAEMKDGKWAKTEHFVEDKILHPHEDQFYMGRPLLELLRERKR